MSDNHLVRRRQASWLSLITLGSRRGELSEGILEALRDAREAINVAQCAEALAERKGIPAGDLTRFKANVSAAMTYLGKRDRVRRVHNGDGRNVAWEIAR